MFLILQILFFFLILSYENPYEVPPGTVQVGENFFVDGVEISNRHYVEYLTWLTFTYSDTSALVREAIPKVSVLESIAKRFGIEPSDYLMGDEYSLYPVLAVKLSQASAFCAWRSERVHELLEHFKDKDVIGKQHSSLMVMLGGRLFPSKKEKKVRYPEYRIPTADEWTELSIHEKVENKFVHQLIELPYYPPKSILNLFGSVSEMTTTHGLSKGGSYKDDKTQLNSDWDRPYTGPSDWLGFRCVCSWKEQVD